MDNFKCWDLISDEFNKRMEECKRLEKECPEWTEETKKIVEQNQEERKILLASMGGLAKAKEIIIKIRREQKCQ